MRGRRRGRGREGGGGGGGGGENPAPLLSHLWLEVRISMLCLFGMGGLHSHIYVCVTTLTIIFPSHCTLRCSFVRSCHSVLCDMM